MSLCLRRLIFPPTVFFGHARRKIWERVVSIAPLCAVTSSVRIDMVTEPEPPTTLQCMNVINRIRYSMWLKHGYASKHEQFVFVLQFLGYPERTTSRNSWEFFMAFMDLFFIRNEELCDRHFLGVKYKKSGKF